MHLKKKQLCFTYFVIEKLHKHESALKVMEKAKKHKSKRGLEFIITLCICLKFIFFPITNLHIFHIYVIISHFFCKHILKLI